MAFSERSSQSSAGSEATARGGGCRAFVLWCGEKREVGNHTYYDRWMESTRHHATASTLTDAYSIRAGPVSGLNTSGPSAWQDGEDAIDEA